MDGPAPSLSAQQLYAQLGTARTPVILDARKRDVDDRLILGAVHYDTNASAAWLNSVSASQPVVVYCAHGAEVSQTAAAQLQRAGILAAYLEGGIEAWRAQNLPTRKEVNAPTDKWVTRERPKIDRIACPWLIRRFIDPSAEFLYVPTPDVLATAKKTGAVPYDIEGVEFAHEGEHCSFDTLLRIFGIQDRALDQLAIIVRGADTSRHDLAAQCSGLFAISLGLSANFPNDHEMLAHGMVMYDALYTWCRSLQHETHNWPAKTANVA